MFYLSKDHRQSFIYGATILGISMIIVKIIGAFFKIPLGNILGNTGMGYFSTAYNIFVPIYTLAMAGFPAAVSKLVSEASVKGNYRDARKIFKISSTFYFLTGIVGFFFIVFIAKYFSTTFADEKSFLSIIAIAPAVFFGCIMSSFRGYYEGLRNMKPTAISQIIESFVKLILGLFMSSSVINIGFYQYSKTGFVFGVIAKSRQEANLIILPYASAAAILGVTISTFIGMVYLIYIHKKKLNYITKKMLIDSPKASGGKIILKKLISIAIPISIGALVINLTSMIDLVTIISRLDHIVDTNLEELISSFNGLIPIEIIEKGTISNFIWGAYGGLAVSIFNLVPAFTNIFAKSALPNVSAQFAMNNNKSLKKSVESVIRVTTFFAIPAGTGIFIMSEQILMLLYSSKSSDALVAAPTLSIMGIGVIFLSIVTPIFAILQGVGRQYLPVIFMLIGATIKYIINYILVGIPSINIIGAPLGTIACYGLILIFCLFSLKHIIKVKISYFNIFVKPLIAGFFCGITAWSSYGLVSRMISKNISTIISIGLAGVVYMIVLIILKAITEDDIMMLPKGDKLLKLFSKIVSK